MIPLFVPAAVPLMAGPRLLPACVCSHSWDVHDHLRRGTDCGMCGRQTCEAYRASGWRAWVREVRALMWPPGTEPAPGAPAVIETSHELAEPGDVTWLDRQNRDKDDGLLPSDWTWLHGGEK